MIAIALLLASKGIIGELNWQEVSSLHPKDPVFVNSKSVVELKNGSGEICNGYRVRNNIILTAAHCISGNIYLGDRTCRVLSVDRRKDVSELSCDDSIWEIYYVDRREVTPEVYLLHYQCQYLEDPFCKPTLKYSPGVVVKRQGTRLCYTCDSLPGSSGAPVFNNNHELIAIHHSYVESEGYNCGSLVE